MINRSKQHTSAPSETPESSSNPDRSAFQNRKVNRTRAALTAGAALTAAAALFIGDRNTSFEQADDVSTFEMEAILNSEIVQGVLTVSQGVNIRHTPEINKLDDSSGDLTDNLAGVVPEGTKLIANGPLMTTNPRTNEVWYGFLSPEDNVGLYWISASAKDENGENLVFFQPTYDSELSSSPVAPTVTSAMTSESPASISIQDPRTGMPTAQSQFASIG